MMASGTDFDSSFITEVLPAFISEAQEQIEAIEQLLLQIESAPDNRELLDALFRCAHTVKGSAGIFGLERVVAFTHHVETLLDGLRDGRLKFSAALGTLLLRCNDEIRSLVASAADHQPDSPEALASRAELVAELQAFSAPGTASAPATVARWRIAVSFGRETFRNGMDPLALLSYLRGLGTLTELHCDEAAVPPLDDLDPENCHLALEFELGGDVDRPAIESAFSFVREDCELQIEAVQAAPRLGEILLADRAVTPEALAAALQKQARQTERAATSAPADDQRVIRVQADRLDAVINLLGELVIASAGASMMARGTRNASLVEAIQQVSSLIEEVRKDTLQLRMVPIGETFARFRRVVRDTAAELGKDVRLEIVGGETDLDKSVIERIADPLMHVVRNALDHGLEPPAERLAAGKPAQGTLTLSACHEGGGILIRVSDDGRGIRRDKVLQRAWERGLVEPGVTPSDEDIFNLIFEPGFSTAEQVTNLSGRGVGMDVVRRNVQALRGSVGVLSRPGTGSAIEIRLPLTLAIIDGFLVAVGPSKFVLPLEAVVEVIENRPLRGAHDGRGRGVVDLRGHALPVVDLRTLYALQSPEPPRASVVVLQAGAQRCGVIVDQLLGQHQTVIKPLGRMFRSLRGMSGSTILGNGDVALIFDVNALAQLAAEAPAVPPSRSTTPPLQGQVQ